MAISTTTIPAITLADLPILDANALSITNTTSTNWTISSLSEIKGIPIYAEIEKSRSDFQDRIVDEYDIKLRLCELLIQELFKNNAIEFTKEENLSMGTVICRARIFATPNNQVQLLRVNKVIK